MQGDGGTGTTAGAVAEEVSEEHPPTDLLESSIICGGQERTVLDTPSQSGDLKCITLSSTPFRKVSTPRDISLDTEMAGDWSVSMATPTTFQHLPIGSTPIITTTDEEASDVDRSATGPIRGSEMRQPVDKSVVRTLFSATRATSSPSSRSPPHTHLSTSTAAARRLQSKVDNINFSPISASPLLCCTQPTTDPHHTTSTSLISTHTVAETPTRLRSKRTDRESVGLNKAFCDDSGQPMACSQELFESPEVFVEDDTVGPVTSIPDSPPSEERTLVEEDKEPQSPSGHGDVALCEREKETASCRLQLMPDTIAPPTIAGDYSSPPEVHRKSRERVHSASNFHYPSNRQLFDSLHPSHGPSSSREVRQLSDSLQPSHGPSSNREVRQLSDSLQPSHGPSSNREVRQLSDSLQPSHGPNKEVQCSAVESLPQWRPCLRGRGKRKRTLSSLVAPPEKKISLASSVGCDDVRCGSVGKSVSDSVLVAQDESELVTVEQSTEARPLAGVRDSCAPELSKVASKREAPSPALVADDVVAGSVTGSETGKMAESAHTVSAVLSFTGFKMASGRSLSISERSLQNAHKFIAEDTDEQDCKTTPLPPTTLVTPSTALTTGRTRGRARQTKPFKAPRLASSVGKEEEAVRVARLLQGMRGAVAGSVAPAVSSTPQLVESGFSTGSGRKLSISASSFQRARQLVAEDKENGIAATAEPGAVAAVTQSCGFQSASGKRVRVSAQAVERARSLIADTGQGISSGPPTELSCVAPDAVQAKASEVQQPLTFYTGGELGKDDLIDFAVFSQFNETVGDGGGNGGSAVTAVSGREREEEDCSACFSTQVVKQFLDFSAEEEEEKQPAICSHPPSPEGLPLLPATPPSTNRHPTPPPNDRHPTPPHPPPTDTAPHPPPTGMAPNPPPTTVPPHPPPTDRHPTPPTTANSQQDAPQRETENGSKMVDASCDQSCLMDELFGVASNMTPSQSTPAEGVCGIMAGPTAVEEVMRQENSDGLEKMSSEGEMEGGGVCDGVEEGDGQGKEDISDHLIEESSRPQERMPLSFPGLMTASGRKISISSDALSAARAVLLTTPTSHPPPLLTTPTSHLPPDEALDQDRVSVDRHQPSVLPQHSMFRGLQTAGGKEVRISEAALEAVRQRDLAPSSSSASTVSTQPRPVAERRRITPHFKPLTMQRPSTSSSGGSVRYKPVFRSGQQTPSFQHQTLTPHPLSQRDRHSRTRALHSTPEGVLHDRAPGRRPLTPMQTYLGPDGSYVSTPVQRYNLRTRSAVPVSTASGRPTAGGEGEEGREVRREVRREETSVQSSADARECERCGVVDQPNQGSGESTESHQEEDQLEREEGADMDQLEREEGADMADMDQLEREERADMDQLEREEGADMDQLEREEGADMDQLEREKGADMDQLEREEGASMDQLEREEEERQSASGREGSVCAVDQLNDSLEEEVVADEPSTPLPSVQFYKHSRRTTAKKRIPPRSTGSVLTARVEWSEGRVALMDLPGCRVPARYTERQLCEAGVHPATLRVRASNAATFQFSGDNFFSSAVLGGAPVCVGDGAVLRLRERQAGVRELWEAFAVSPGVDKKLVSFEWFSNHYRWTVWKLAAMEISFPAQCAGRYLTPDWLMKQLRYRYDREVEAAERPALRKICERDDVSHRRLALCVSAVYSNPPPTPTDEKEKELPSIQVTDGWYCLPAILDSPLRYMVGSGRISVGTKILTSGVELVGSSDPCHPLDATSDLCLRLSANSTRRARWFTKLGYQPCPRPFCLPLSSLFPDGGVVGCTEAVIARVYPLIYMEKMEDGRKVFRGGRSEERALRSHQELRQQKIEAISNRVQRDFEEEFARREQRNGTWRRSRRLNTLQVKQLQDGEAIHAALTNSLDPQTFQEALSSMQLALLESYRQSLVVSQQTELQHRIEEAVKREEEDGRLPHTHTTTPLLRVRLVPPGLSHAHVDCQLSVWRPSEGVRAVLVEGRVVRMWNVNTASSKRSGQFLQLSATQNTRFHLVDMDTTTMETTLMGYHPRECVSIGSLVRGEGVWYGEVDTVGVVVCVTSDHMKEATQTRAVDMVYLADSDCHVMATAVWDGLEHHALQGLLSPAAIVSVTSLTYRGSRPTSGYVLTSAGDHAHFSQAPSDPHMRAGLQQLRAALPRDLQTYLHSLEGDIMENIHL